MKKKTYAVIRLEDVEGVPVTPQVIFQKHFLSNELPDWFKHNQRVVVTIESFRKTRSLAQNAVLHWYVGEIAEETGVDALAIKEALKMKYLMVPVTNKNGDVLVDEKTGEVMQRVKSTTELSTTQMMDFLEDIRTWALDFLSLRLPLPNEEVELKFKGLD